MVLRRSLKRKPLLASSPLRVPPEAIRIIPERAQAARNRDCGEIRFWMQSHSSWQHVKVAILETVDWLLPFMHEVHDHAPTRSRCRVSLDQRHRRARIVAVRGESEWWRLPVSGSGDLRWGTFESLPMLSEPGPVALQPLPKSLHIGRARSKAEERNSIIGYGRGLLGVFTGKHRHSCVVESLPKHRHLNPMCLGGLNGLFVSSICVPHNTHSRICR